MKARKLISVLLALLMTSCIPGLSAITASAYDYSQTIYFEFPTDGTWGDPNGVRYVYCYLRVIDGEPEYFTPVAKMSRQSRCVNEGNNLYSFDIYTKCGMVEDGVEYAVSFSTDANGGFETVEMILTSDCIGDTLKVTPYEGTVSRTDVDDSTKNLYYAAWEENTNCGPLAVITPTGELTPGCLPFYQPHAKTLSDALKKYLVSNESNAFFQLDNNISLCDVTGASPQEVYEQYLNDNSELIDN